MTPTSGLSHPLYHLDLATIMRTFATQCWLMRCWPKTVWLATALLLGASLLTTACVNLEPRQSNIRYYLLSDAVTPMESPESAASGATSGPNRPRLIVGIRKVRVAAYLNTPSITTRFGDHEVQFSEFHRWGEDLGEAIGRSVAQSLVRQPEIQRVDRVPWPERTSHDVLVQMQVLRFEGEASSRPVDVDREDAPMEGSARVVVAWELVDPETQDVKVSGKTDHREGGWPVGEYAALVKRLDASLDVVARDLANQMLAGRASVPEAQRER